MEPWRYGRLGQTDKSAIAPHCWALGLQVRFDKTTVLYRLSSWHSQLTQAWLEIVILEKALNKEEGTGMSTAWLPLYERLTKRKERDPEEEQNGRT